MAASFSGSHTGIQTYTRIDAEVRHMPHRDRYSDTDAQAGVRLAQPARGIAVVTNDQLKHDLATLRRELTAARANGDHEQIVLLQLDVATVNRQMAQQQRAASHA